jgi:uncharacterized membrane protein
MSERPGTTAPTGELQNVQAIADLERTSRERRTPIECVSDAVTSAAGSLPFIVFHLLWFGGWIAINSSPLQFDPFPFSLLTMIVSLEAILLSALLLMSQNRQMHDADRRAHLDLQVNLLAEQELTAILRVLMRLARHAKIDIADEMPELRPLLRSTNVNELADLVQRNIEAERGPAP